MSELRWNPLLGEWVATATHRQDRTFLPPKDFCPLCPTKPGGFPTEVPEPTYDIVVFDNRFPSLVLEPPPPAVAPTELYPVAPAAGACEVVLYSPDHGTSLARQPATQIHKLIQVWTDRYRELGALEFVKYVFIFENKGEEIGVTLHHPHGQIYAYPFIPPMIQRELETSRAHHARTGHCLLCTIGDEERRGERRLVAQNESFSAYLPFFARWPYEVHISPRRHVTDLTAFTAAEAQELAAILKSVLVGYDAVFDRSFPYVMALHQSPSDGGNYEHYHFHIELYPPLRTATKLKYLAGSEIGAGVFVNDTLAEETASTLRSKCPPALFESLG
ncbi:MAG TPA: galactose-1-phosphate uridylyltransferase [Myxococcaceae bacterium]|nr:galactose-1-phosphate uridylyltransferase [Myxococcaceae bacterium]